MKKNSVLYIALVVLLISCKKEVKNTPIIEQRKGGSMEIPKEVVKKCYSRMTKKDTILLSFSMKEDQTFVGELNYKLFEKDKNIGTLSGVQKGDTLIADYTFMSEGTTSVRQVAFLKKGNTYIEGFGYMIEDSKGRIVFRHLNQLQFDGNIVLTKEDCKI